MSGTASLQGGARAGGSVSSGELARFRCSRIRATTVGFSMQAILTALPHRSQAVTSILNTLARRCAHVRSCELHAARMKSGRQFVARCSNARMIFADPGRGHLCLHSRSLTRACGADESLCRYAQFLMQTTNHGDRQPASAVQNLSYTRARADQWLQILPRETHLLHAEQQSTARRSPHWASGVST